MPCEYCSWNRYMCFHSNFISAYRKPSVCDRTQYWDRSSKRDSFFPCVVGWPPVQIQGFLCRKKIKSQKYKTVRKKITAKHSLGTPSQDNPWVPFHLEACLLWDCAKVTSQVRKGKTGEWPVAYAGGILTSTWRALRVRDEDRREQHHHCGTRTARILSVHSRVRGSIPLVLSRQWNHWRNSGRSW